MQKFHRYIQALLATSLSLGLLAILVGVTFAASAHPAFPAHAKVTRAIPAIGSTIAQPPTKVTVFALENINPDPKGSNLFVYGPGGDLISQGNATIPLSSPKEMSISIKPSGNGVYVVRWITVSADDGDPDQGAFVYTVKPAAAATPTATSHGTTTTTTNSGSGGMPLWVPILVGILALLIGGGIGLGIGRSAARPARLSALRQNVAAQQREETPTSHP